MVPVLDIPDVPLIAIEDDVPDIPLIEIEDDVPDICLIETEDTPDEPEPMQQPAATKDAPADTPPTEPLEQQPDQQPKSMAAPPAPPAPPAPKSKRRLPPPLPKTSPLPIELKGPPLKPVPKASFKRKAYVLQPVADEALT